MGGGSARGRGPQREGGTRVEREKERESEREREGSGERERERSGREGVNERETERFIHTRTHNTHTVIRLGVRRNPQGRTTMHHCIS